MQTWQDWLPIATVPAGVVVLVYNEGGSIREARYHPDLDEWRGADGTYDLAPTHWLPRPPDPPLMVC